jgi:hypothetical protein
MACVQALCKLIPNLKLLQSYAPLPVPGSTQPLSTLVYLEELHLDGWIVSGMLDASFYSALRSLPRLHSLSVKSRHSIDFNALAAVSQLRKFEDNAFDLGRGLLQLSALTSITCLSVCAWLARKEDTGVDSAYEQQQRQIAQSELATSLDHLPQLQHLSLMSPPVGPVTDALARLPGLTSLKCWAALPIAPVGQGHPTWRLPFVIDLCLSMTWQQLASLHAPQLRRLRGSQPRGQLWLNSLFAERRKQPKPGPEVRLAAAKGPLRWCNRVVLHWPSLTAAEVSEWLSSLAEGWQPDASVMQPCEDDLEAWSLYRLGIGRQLSDSNTRVWELELNSFDASLTAPLLTLLPTGLNYLSIW